MSGIKFGVTAAMAAMLVACGSTSQEASGSPPAALSPSSAASASPVTLDPCQIVPAAEASLLTGASYQSGTEHTSSGGAQICVYGSNTHNVLQVLVNQAADAATAQGDWAQNEAKAQDALKQLASAAPGVNVSLTLNDTTVSGADKAAAGSFTATYSGTTINGSAIYVLKGRTFLSISDLALAQASPTPAALEAEAVTAIGRMPSK